MLSQPLNQVSKLRRLHPSKVLLLLCGVLAAGAWQSASAKTLCVNPAGSYPCYSKIQLAVNAAASGDVISVAPGTYSEDVLIGKPLSLLAATPGKTTINATTLPYGIYIDGLDNPGLSNVEVSGFSVKNAENEGILISNSSFVVVRNNQVTANNQGLTSGCPGIQSFELAESFDCGEGIHLSAVDHSTFADNVIENNAGGILVSDDTGPTHDNLITGNTVEDNPFDCGITLASHPFSAYAVGITHNTIANNTSSHNGYQEPGAGAGVGIFAAGPGGNVSDNLVINNTLENNGLPGVTFHSHDPFDDLNDNMIVGNYISGNGADTDDALTPGTTGINVFGASPIVGTLIAQNVITNQDDDIVVKTTGHVEAHLNDLIGNGTGLANVDANGSGFGTVGATENWWGCSDGPGARKCTTTSGPNIVSSPWLGAFYGDPSNHGLGDH